MYSLETTNQYLKDLKTARKRNLDEERLNEVIKILLSGKSYPTNTATIS
jgi:mRNA interferase YafQ